MGIIVDLSGIGIVFGRGTLRSGGGENKIQGGTFQRIHRRKNHSKHPRCHFLLPRREKDCPPRPGKWARTYKQTNKRMICTNLVCGIQCRRSRLVLIHPTIFNSSILTTYRPQKPENFLLTDKTDNAQIKVIDFG